MFPRDTYVLLHLFSMEHVATTSSMTLAKVRSGAVVGIDGILVDVEVDIGSGLPAFHIVGLPDAAVQEAKERVRAAIRNTGFEFPLRRITVNLAPADVRKQGPLYDLPIAVAILVASRQVPDHFEEMALLGELSLDGRLRHVNGVLPLVSMCADHGIGTAVVPPSDVAEARLAERVDVRGLTSLANVREAPGDWTCEDREEDERSGVGAAFDLAVVQGQEHVKRALEVAAAGGPEAGTSNTEAGPTAMVESRWYTSTVRLVPRVVLRAGLSR